MDPLKYFYKNVPHSAASKLYYKKNNRYFIVKPSSADVLFAALEYDVWGTRSISERVLSKLFDRGSNVILLFTSVSNNNLLGYALVKSRPGEASKNKSKSTNVKFEGPLFDIAWIRFLEIKSSDYSQLLNKCNDEVPVVESKDGQEVDSLSGYKICSMFEKKFKRYLESTYKFPNSLSPIPNPQVPEIASKFIMTNNQREMISNAQDIMKFKGANVFSLDMAADFNPALLIFPVDLSNMSYNTYISLYQRSLDYWLEMPEDFEIPLLTG